MHIPCFHYVCILLTAEPCGVPLFLFSWSNFPHAFVYLAFFKTKLLTLSNISIKYLYLFFPMRKPV